MPKVVMQFFQINLEALQTKNPHLAQRLQNIGEVKDFEIFMDEGDVATLNFVHAKHFIPLYEGSPAQTIYTQMQEFQKFAKFPYLYFYGLGNGVFLKHLLQNPLHKRIMVIEPELELLYVVLHMVDFSQELREDRLVLYAYEDVDFPSMAVQFLKYQEQKHAKTYDLHIQTSYYDKLFFEHIQYTNRTIIEAIYHAVNIAGNDTVDALIGLKHHVVNLKKVLQTPPLFHLIQKLGTCQSAVLVSTGPSLTKQLPLLKEIAPYVRIIAVDASFPVLYKAGIKPDVVVSIERVVQSARFFTEMPAEAFEDVVFALSSVQHKEVVESIKGGMMQLSLRSLGFMMYTGPDEWGYLGIGQSAANMAYELIYHSKFQNCILIGQDLAYGEDGKSHASGHVFGEENVKTKENDVWIKGWGGKSEVRTNHTWDMFRKSFEKDIAETKQTMLTINATEGGASIYGTLEIPFSEAIERYVNTKEPKRRIEILRAAAHERERIAVQTWNKVETMRAYVSELCEESKALFLEIAQTIEHPKEVYEIQTLQNLVGRAEAIKARYEEDIYEKVAWHIAQSTMLSKEIELAPAEVYIAKDELDEKERLWHLLERYKPWLFHFAGIMDAIVKTIDYAKVRRLIDEVQTIDVYCENKKIDSFGCSDMKAGLGRVFDVDMRGILYDVPDAYQDKIEAIGFKDAKTGEELPRTFVDVIRKDDAKYNELSFMKSLEEPIDEEKIKDLYCPNAIGFLATEENLEDEEFVGYINELLGKFPELRINGFVFNEKQKQQALLSFQIQKNLSFVIINNITDLLKNSEIYFALQYSSIDFAIRDYIQDHTAEILFLDYRSSWHGKGFAPIPQKVKTNVELFGGHDYKQYNSLQEFFYSSIMKNLTQTKYVFDQTKDLYQLVYYDTIDYVLHIQGFKELYLKFRTILNRIK
jgi:hypothetical protein